MADIAVTRGTGTRTIDWSAAIVAGLIAGVVFLMMEMFLMPLFGLAPSMWAPPRMIGAIGLGEAALPPPATFDLTIVMVAMAIHFANSIVFAIVVAYIIRNLTTVPAILVGVVAALLLYVFVFYVMTQGPWPWFENGRNWLNIVAHIVFGAIVAWWYRARAHPVDEHVHA
jgi:uncharacterized membrane protein YagU involved in acid resistance